MDEPADVDARELSAEVMGVRWSVPEGDFAVLDAVTDEGEGVVLVGALGHVREGEAVEVRGGWRRHPRHGWQFAAQRVRVREPVSEQALIAYLTSVKHVGPRGATFLVERHGEDVLAAIDRDPRRALAEVPGIGPTRLGAALRSWRRQAQQRALRLFLDEHGVESAAAGRILRHFGPGSLERVRADPYAICEVDGIGFVTADALAAALGTAPDAPERIAAGVVHALALAESDGHCHLPRGELVGRAGRLLGGGGAEVEVAVDGLAARGRVVIIDEERVAEARLHAVEERLGRHVRSLVDASPAFSLRRVARPVDGPFVPSDDQWRGVTQVLSHRLSILTGGPGSGKTATMRALVDLLRDGGRTARLCAPTGKAARRLSETTGAEATTIHRLLEWLPGEGFSRGADNPIDGCDVLVVDEASMLSVRLAEALLAAVGPRTHVLLVGDVDQLAPVGPGRVLEDLLDARTVPATRLTEVFRQAARSMIVRAAHAVNAGQLPPRVPRPDDVRDFFVVARESADAIFAEVCSLAATRIPAHYGLDATADVQVLAPVHRGPVGIHALNGELRARLNPDGEPIGGTAFRVGDRVLQTVNSYEHDLFNGERGVLAHHDAERDRVLFAGEDGRRLTVAAGALATLALAYCSSVHKAQGSQARAVIVPIFSGHHVMLTRNLVYTALTRAQEVCVLVGEMAALAAAVRRTDARRRHTRLRELAALSATSGTGAVPHVALSPAGGAPRHPVRMPALRPVRPTGAPRDA